MGKLRMLWSRVKGQAVQVREDEAFEEGAKPIPHGIIIASRSLAAFPLLILREMTAVATPVRSSMSVDQQLTK